MSQQYGDTEPGEPDPANATAEELKAKASEEDREAVRRQVEQILAESEDRTEENATVDPDDHSVIRRRTEETAESPPDEPGEA